MLYEIHHDLRTKLWCGIAALAACTGRPTSECRDAIRDQRVYSKTVMGIHRYELLHALRRFGYKGSLTHRSFNRKITFNQWRKERTPDERKHPCIVVLRRHYVVVDGMSFVDNRHTNPIWLPDAPYQRSHVEATILVKR